MTIFPSAYQINYKIVDERLHQLLSDLDTPLCSAARYSLLSPGKRFRPCLVLATLATLGGDSMLGLDPACAIEMVHAYSLIHDDLPCMDDDDLRRGQPTLHKVFGEGMALLAGDYLLTYAFEVVAKAPALSCEKKLHLIQTLAQAAGAEGMVGGQAIDLSSSGKCIREEMLFKMHHGKTGALLSASLRFGALIAEASHSILDLFDRLGLEIGLAFQFLDDLLDVTSSPEILGKNIQKDTANKKPTAITFYGIEGVKRKLETFKHSINGYLSLLPSGASEIASLLQQHLWDRAEPVCKASSV